MHGFALLLVIWLLAIITILATVFIAQAQVEKEVTRNYTDDQIAKMLSESGIEIGISGIQTAIRRGLFNEDGSLVSTINGSRLVQTPDGSVNVSVKDLQGRININEGIVDGIAKYPKDHSVVKNLIRILNILGTEIGVGNSLGTILIDNRPPAGYKTELEIERVIKPQFPLTWESGLNKLLDNITFYSWTNNKVCNPAPLSLEEEASYPIKFTRPNNIYRFGHNIDYQGNPINQPLRFYDPVTRQYLTESQITVHKSLNPLWIEVVDRSPVNINTASKEVLVSLLTDLQGFFLLPKRIPSPKNLNIYPTREFDKTISYNYGTANDNNFYESSVRASNKISDDALGALYKTFALNARDIADAIIRARSKQREYSNLSFGGVFRTWNQFNYFADDLVKTKPTRRPIIEDTRSFLDYIPTPQWTSQDNARNILATQESNVQKRIASQAMADLLKANFNPNLTLNELNPDRNIYTLVDKTDLIVNSTEFCFTPMGYFYIDCTAETGNGPGPKVKKKKRCIIKAFDTHHETSQSDFYNGRLGDRVSNPVTNSFCAVETGPEPDNGPGPSLNNYSGYVSLSTNLGTRVKKPKNELWTTYYGADTIPPEIKRTEESRDAGITTLINEGLFSDLHCHYQFDHVAHITTWSCFLCGEQCLLPAGPLTRVEEHITSYIPAHRQTVTTTFENFPDKGETNRAPYSPISSADGRHTLCKVMRAGEHVFRYSPGDLRTDGAYFEFNTAVGYSKPISWNPLNLERYSVKCMWIKPNFYPENTGKVRTFMSANSYGYIGGTPWYTTGLYYFPSPQAPASPYLPLSWFDYSPRNCIGMSSYISISLDPSRSLIAGFIEQATRMGLIHGFEDVPESMLFPPNMGMSVYVPSDTLNHEFDQGTIEDHDRYRGGNGKHNILRNNEWIFVRHNLSIDRTQQYRARQAQLYINGQLYDSKVFLDTMSWDGAVDGLEEQLGQSFAIALRLYYGPYIMIGGELTKIATNGVIQRNARTYYADSTIDEFYLWLASEQNRNATDDGQMKSELIGSFGRYYKPNDNNENDGIYTSGLVTKFTNNPQKPLILGIAWTCYAEDYDLANLRPVFYNYQDSGDLMTPDKDTPRLDSNGYPTHTVCLMYAKKNGQRVGTYGNEGYSPVDIRLEENDRFQYEVKFRCGISGSILSIGLHATPILDDVTIYYTTGLKIILYHDL